MGQLEGEGLASSSERLAVPQHEGSSPWTGQGRNSKETERSLKLKTCLFSRGRHHSRSDLSVVGVQEEWVRHIFDLYP